ncbi:MAG: SDR family NAD(P)-dependent oxidoreductase [Jatrophihabitans sp.]|nr:MAG: SDR family NAD(P)-dependent oxidoreductase [Jatrophihabitans sp.]
MVDRERYGPWAVVAGGSEGVGASFAMQLADAGIDLLLTARNPGPLEQTAQRARARGAQVRTACGDLREPGTLDAIVGAAAELDVGLLVFNAGANSYGAEFVEGDLAGFQGVVDLNVGALLRLTHHFGKRLKDRGRGGLLLVGSLAGYLGQPQIGVYSAVKAFDRVFAEGLWAELGPVGVDVLHLVLGVTRTPAMERAGLRMDLPGLNVAEPDDVAREGLAHLADGPVWVAAGNLDTARARSDMDRAALVRKAVAATRRLVPAE